MHRARRAASRRYEEALRAEPGHGGALHHLGLLRHGAGRPTEAIELLSRAVDALPGDAAVVEGRIAVIHARRRDDDVERATEENLLLLAELAGQPRAHMEEVESGAPPSVRLDRR